MDQGLGFRAWKGGVAGLGMSVSRLSSFHEPVLKRDGQRPFQHSADCCAGSPFGGQFSNLGSLFEGVLSIKVRVLDRDPKKGRNPKLSTLNPQPQFRELPIDFLCRSHTALRPTTLAGFVMDCPTFRRRSS